MDLNRYTATGNLTSDPVLRELPSGSKVCELRIANNGLGRGDREAVGFLNVSVYGKAAEICARYLAKGRPVAIDGRLEWHEWPQDGAKRSAIGVVANSVKFLGTRDSQAAGEDPEPAGVADASEDSPF